MERKDPRTGFYCSLFEGHWALNQDRNQPFYYWAFATSDLSNWKSQNSPFSENSQGLMTLLKTVPFTHHPTWDNCVLHGGVGLGLGGSPKIGSGPHREPTANQTVSDGRIPSISPQIVLQHG